MRAANKAVSRTERTSAIKAGKSPSRPTKATTPRKNAIPETPSDQTSQTTPDGLSSEPPNPQVPITRDCGIVNIDPRGDVVLKVLENDKAALEDAPAFRLSTTTLKSNSKYFERLLQAGRFDEGRKVETAHQLLRDQHGEPANAPVEELPLLKVQDLGRISKVKALEALLTDFFLILHGRELLAAPPTGNLANLAIVADRFDALDSVLRFVARKRLLRLIDGKTTPKTEAALSEEKVRQRLLVALLLDYPPWVKKYSAQLIVKGWVGQEVDMGMPLWWDLPSRVEEELVFRRECVLDTIQSMQSYFLGLYTSRERQCKLGYDSSAQCDSFQLGEMVRFLARVGTLNFQGGLIDTAEPPEPYGGDVISLLDNLRQVPEYQIDRFHSHCGIRTRLIPLLDLVQQCLQTDLIGICLECWQASRVEYAWIEANKPLAWKRSDSRIRVQGCTNKHVGVREMFMAGEKDWAS